MWVLKPNLSHSHCNFRLHGSMGYTTRSGHSKQPDHHKYPWSEKTRWLSLARSLLNSQPKLPCHELGQTLGFLEATQEEFWKGWCKLISQSANLAADWTKWRFLWAESLLKIRAQVTSIDWAKLDDNGYWPKVITLPGHSLLTTQRNFQDPV